MGVEFTGAEMPGGLARVALWRLQGGSHGRVLFLALPIAKGTGRPDEAIGPAPQFRGSIHLIGGANSNRML